MLSLSLHDDSYQPLRVEIDTLEGGAAYDDKQHFLDYIDRFVAIIEDPLSASPELRNYLLTEGGHWAMDGIPLGAMHLLYWLDQKLKAHKADVGYVNRLSEAGAGWGEAAPDNLTDADPLDLVTTLQGIGGTNTHNVAIVDHDAVTDGLQGSDNGPVRVTRASTSCTLLDGSTAKNFGGSASLTKTDGVNANSLYRYRLLYSLYDLNEANGGNIRFPLSLTRPAIMLVRNTVAEHIVNVENQIGITNTASPQQQCPYVLIRGYPGEWPEIWCGNSTDNDASPSAGECPHTGLTPKSGLSANFVVGPASTKLRNNVHFRNLWIHGKRETAGGKWIYSDMPIYVANGTGGTMRFCILTDNQPIIPTDDNAATFPNLVDFAYTARTAPAFRALYCRQSGFVFDSNLVEPVAVADWPTDSGSTVSSVTGRVKLDFGNGATTNDVRVTRNTVRGVSKDAAIKLDKADNCYVAHNDVELYYSEGIACFSVDGAVVEFNRVHHFADANRCDVSLAGNGISFQNSSNCTAQDNVLYNVEPMLRANGLSMFSSGDSGTPQMAGHIFRRNLLYRVAFHVDDNQQDVVPEDCEIYDNLFCGVPETMKGTRNDAPITVETNLSGVLDYTLTIYRNNFWRFADGTPGQTTIEAGDHIKIYNGVAQSTGFEVGDTLTNFTNNTAVLPKFASVANAEASGDFTFSADSPFKTLFHPNMPLTQSQSQAWTPD